MCHRKRCVIRETYRFERGRPPNDHRSIFSSLTQAGIFHEDAKFRRAITKSDYKNSTRNITYWYVIYSRVWATTCTLSAETCCLNQNQQKTVNKWDWNRVRVSGSELILLILKCRADWMPSSKRDQRCTLRTLQKKKQYIFAIYQRSERWMRIVRSLRKECCWWLVVIRNS